MLKKLLSSQLRVNMASGVLMAAINIVVLGIAYPVYLHFLGYEKYGVWLVLATVLSFVQMGGNLGIQSAVMKLVAEEYGRKNIRGVQSYAGMAIATLTVSGTVGLVAVLCLKMQIIRAFRLGGDNAILASRLLPYIGLLCIYIFIVRVLNATLSGLGRMDLANYIQTGGRIVAVAVAAVLLYSGRGIESLLIGNTLSYVFIHVVSLICIWRITHIHLLRLRNLDAQRGKRLLRFGGAVFGGSVISMLFSPFNKLMLSRYVGVASVPIYDIAFRGSVQVRSLVQAGLRPLMPEISRLSANMTRNAKARISQIYRRAMRFIFLFGTPVCGGLIMSITPLLKFWLGPRFVDELPIAFRIMLASVFLNLLSVPSYYTLQGLGMVRYTLIAHIILSGVSAVIILTIILVGHDISVEKVCCAALTATAISTLYLRWNNKQRVLKG